MSDPLTTTELVPEITPEQYALLDALRDVAIAPEAPAARYATEQIARLAGEAFGYPVPSAEVVRRGGLADLFYGRPVRVDQLATGGPIPRRPTGKGLGAVPSAVIVDELHQPEGDDQASSEGWPFAPGTVVRDEDGAEVEWLEAAPEGTVVRDELAREWTRDTIGWWSAAATDRSTSLALADLGPLTVVSVPDQEAGRG